MTFHISRTEKYHRQALATLGWELTICNTLEDPSSPIRPLLATNGTFGLQLATFLGSRLPLRETVHRVLEVGGGYGYLMRDLLRRYPDWNVAMLDLSPELLKRQKETLRGLSVRFMEGDFLELDSARLAGYDLVLLNEIIGDFPTAVGLPPEISEESKTPECAEAFAWVRRFDLEVPKNSPYNLNIGALQAVDTLCRAGVPLIFLSEHSCESNAPQEWLPWLDTGSAGRPEAIPLKGHTEYTIKFSHLEKVARHYGYAIQRGVYADILPVNMVPELRYILTSASTEDNHEIIRQFIQDLFKYEYLILMGQTSLKTAG